MSLSTKPLALPLASSTTSMLRPGCGLGHGAGSYHLAGIGTWGFAMHDFTLFGLASELVAPRAQAAKALTIFSTIFCWDTERNTQI
ncbi:hypothetical protein OG828_48405 [Streptomyces sp. NBC_00457]|uniref:hypothetical protein n=1 Tax=Streptomyces sp. NBC_00457 TaxID=2975748 RepID=UPI002E1D5E04